MISIVLMVVMVSSFSTVMAGTVSLELDPVFLKGLGYLHSKSKDSAEKLKALLDESMSRGSDSVYRTSLKVRNVTVMFLTPR